MAGSIRKRPDKGADAYELRVFLGRDASGRVRHKSKLFHGSQRAAERELAKLVTQHDAQPTVVPDEAARPWGMTSTVNDAIAGWRANGWDDLSPSTTRRYESIWATHIRESIGRRKIGALGPYDVELYLRRLKDKGLAESSVRQTRAILHRACRLARKWSGNTLPNPVADTELPEWKLRELPIAVRAPTVDDVRALLAAADARDQRVASFIRVVATTGIRRGEACALRWEDVDLDAAILRIDESIVTNDGGVLVKEPKSKAGIRRLAVDSVTIGHIRAWREEVLRLSKVAESDLHAHHFVFASEPPGEVPPYPDAMSHAFARIRNAAGVAPDIHLHSLRHFQATVLDPVISEAQKQARLGWSTVHMARHYTDVIDEEDRRAAEHIGCLLDDVGKGEPHAGQASVSGAWRSRRARTNGGSHIQVATRKEPIARMY
jgi:integrase